MNLTRNIWKRMWNPVHRRILLVNLILTLFLSLFLEYMERKSPEALLAFINDRTLIFLFNGLLIFLTLSLVLIMRKRIFGYTLLGGAWFLIGLVNGFVLNDRKTPFTAVDFTIIKSILPILPNYLTRWQIAGVILLVIAAVTGMVCLYLYSPEGKIYDPWAGFLLILLCFMLMPIVVITGKNKGQMVRKFDNLIAGYQDYGVAYGFVITAMDTGIDRPIDYSAEKIRRIEDKVDRKTEKLKKTEDGVIVHRPNIIFIQLESFFDTGTVKQLRLSQDPIPRIRRIREEYTSGWLQVPVYGAGTINTEFEVLTGMRIKDFGTGEYPYRSILHKKTCDSICYWLKDLPYESTAIHNNNASFYDRDLVFSNLGFDHFISIENMDVTEKNEVGWARDAVLKHYILDTMKTTVKKDMIYAISVQGHGDYPSHVQEDPEISVYSDSIDEDRLNQYTYYVNQTHDMDAFVGDLLDELEDYPEEVMVIAYGDHLPGMDMEKEDLESGSKFRTPYFIWDNFGLNKRKREEESGTVRSYQLASKVLNQVGIRKGCLNRFHQTMKDSKKYKENLKLLEYDMLYGSNFVREEEKELLPTELTYSLHDPQIIQIGVSGKNYRIHARYLTESSRIFVNGIGVKSRKTGPGWIEISSGAVKDGDIITIHQVSVTNKKITLNQSENYEFHMENVIPAVPVSD
ncbi:MAG: LTA synthase family protein [Eubacterium sp.]|nr:LTA synthase family protein [Eubacterium sp.]